MAITLCGRIDLKSFPPEELVVRDNVAWAKGDLNERLYIWRGKPACAIRISAPLAAQYCGDYTNYTKTGLMMLEAGSTASSQTAFLGSSSGGPDPGTSAPEPGTETEKADRVEKITCIPTDDDRFKFLENMNAGIDFFSVNDKGYQGKALVPSAAAVPMRSNVQTYGPWASNNFAFDYGGTNVRVESDLCPWVFGSTSLMNSMGQQMANAIAVGTNRVETGTVALPGLPQSFTPGKKFTLGATNGGPNLSSFSMSLNSSGATSRYEFRTFTPKLGDFTRLEIETFKQVSQKNSETRKFISQERINANRSARKINTIRGMINRANGDEGTRSPTRKPSSQRMIVAEVIKQPLRGNEAETIQRSMVGFETFAGGHAEMIENYKGKAFLTLDALLSPVSILGGGASGPDVEGWITPFSHYTNIQNSVKSAPTQPVPPVINLSNDESAHNLEINQKYLNPLTGKFEDGEFHHKGAGYGHNIDIVGREDEVPENSLLNPIIDINDPTKYSQDYRFLGLRGPLVLHQWGYDLEGKPVPNAVDDDMAEASGKFVNSFDFRGLDYDDTEAMAQANASGLKDQFLENWLSKPTTWPAGPIDLRWDRNRGVWVSPPSFKIVAVEATEDIEAYGAGAGKLINRNDEFDKIYGEEIFDAQGNVVKSDSDLNKNTAKITITDRIGSNLTLGQRGYAFFDGFSSEYLMLGGGGGGGTSIRIGKFCNQWPSLSNVKDPGNAVKSVVLYTHSGDCSGSGPTVSYCPWNMVPETEVVDGVERAKTVEVINLFSNVAASEYQTKWCAIAKVGAYYILLAAEC